MFLLSLEMQPTVLSKLDTELELLVAYSARVGNADQEVVLEVSIHCVSSSTRGVGHLLQSRAALPLLSP